MAPATQKRRRRKKKKSSGSEGRDTPTDGMDVNNDPVQDDPFCDLVVEGSRQPRSLELKNGSSSKVAPESQQDEDAARMDPGESSLMKSHAQPEWAVVRRTESEEYIEALEERLEQLKKDRHRQAGPEAEAEKDEAQAKRERTCSQAETPGDSSVAAPLNGLVLDYDMSPYESDPENLGGDDADHVQGSKNDAGDENHLPEGSEPDDNVSESEHERLLPASDPDEQSENVSAIAGRDASNGADCTGNNNNNNTIIIHDDSVFDDTAAYDESSMLMAPKSILEDSRRGPADRSHRISFSGTVRIGGGTRSSRKPSAASHWLQQQQNQQPQQSLSQPTQRSTGSGSTAVAAHRKLASESMQRQPSPLRRESSAGVDTGRDPSEGGGPDISSAMSSFIRRASTPERPSSATTASGRSSPGLAAAGGNVYQYYHSTPSRNPSLSRPASYRSEISRASTPTSLYAPLLLPSKTAPSPSRIMYYTFPARSKDRASRFDPAGAASSSPAYAEYRQQASTYRELVKRQEEAYAERKRRRAQRGQVRRWCDLSGAMSWIGSTICCCFLASDSKDADDDSEDEQ